MRCRGQSIKVMNCLNKQHGGEDLSELLLEMFAVNEELSSSKQAEEQGNKTLHKQCLERSIAHSIHVDNVFCGN